MNFFSETFDNNSVMCVLFYFFLFPGENRNQEDDYDDYQYDYNYDYNSYVSKDELLRYDYNDNYEYRQYGPRYNYSIPHPGNASIIIAEA